MVKKIFPVALVIFFAFLAVFDLHNYGIPPTHDGEYHVMRSWQFIKALSEGNIYPRWAPDFNNGFGIPLFNYVYPLPNYAAALFHFLGFGFIDSLKLNMAAATIIGSILMYLWTKKYWGVTGAVVSSVFYTFSPYHFLDIYVRGSIGEVWSLAIFPGLLWAYLSFYETKKYKYLVLSSVLLALLIYAHNILALLFFSFFLLYSLFIILNSKGKKILFLKTFFICFLGFGLAAPFWLPALLERGYVQGLQIFDVTSNFPELYQLIVPVWGFGLSPTDLANPMSVQIGIANLLAVFVSFIALFFAKNKRIILFFAGSFIIVFFLMTPYSVWFWRNIPLFSYFQFPWRLLSLEILIASFLAGSIVADNLYKKKTKLKLFFSIFLIFISVGLSFTYARAAAYYPRNDEHYLSRSNFTDGTNSPGNAFNTKWLSAVPEKEKNRIEMLGSLDTLKLGKMSSTVYNFEVSSTASSKVVINTVYFPGWAAEVNGKNIRISNNKGRMSIDLPSGTSHVRVFLDSTPVQKLSYVYFFLSVLVLMLMPLGAKLFHPSGRIAVRFSHGKQVQGDA